MTFESLVKINNKYTSCIFIRERGDEGIIKINIKKILNQDINIELSEKLECESHVLPNYS